jgi:hypothetical protein
LAGGCDDVVGGDGGAISHLGEDVSAQQGRGGFLEHDMGAPSVRDMGRIEAAHLFAGGVED